MNGSARVLLATAGLMIFQFVNAQDSTRFRLDAGIFYSSFQQQVKARVGDPRGERLVNQEEIGLMVMGTYRIREFLTAGVFVQFDRGNRHAARFDGFDAEGRTTTRNKIGGFFNEFWMGPFLRFVYKTMFAEAGYGLIGLRNDDARTDLRSFTGDATGTLEVSPRIAWLLALGAGLPISDRLDFIFRMEYRLRYYNEREGNPLMDGIEHGTQNITPFVGVSWNF